MTSDTTIFFALLAIAAVLCYIAIVLRNIDRNLAAWRTAWEQIPAGASDYHAKEIMDATREVAHYLALEKLDREEHPRRLTNPSQRGALE